eukprot:1177440-Rhodomonas_salina.1
MHIHAFEYECICAWKRSFSRRESANMLICQDANPGQIHLQIRSRAMESAPITMSTHAGWWDWSHSSRSNQSLPLCDQVAQRPPTRNPSNVYPSVLFGQTARDNIAAPFHCPCQVSKMTCIP